MKKSLYTLLMVATMLITFVSVSGDIGGDYPTGCTTTGFFGCDS